MKVMIGFSIIKYFTGDTAFWIQRPSKTKVRATMVVAGGVMQEKASSLVSSVGGWIEGEEMRSITAKAMSFKIW